MEILNAVVKLVVEMGWVGVALAGVYLFWRLAMMGSIIMLIKYTVTKIYEYSIDKKERPIIKKTVIEFGRQMITCKVTEKLMLELLIELKGFDGHRSDYVHESDIELALKVLREYNRKKRGKKESPSTIAMTN